MDGDDISLPFRLEKEVSFLDSHPEYAIVSCPMIYFDEKGSFGKGVAIEEPDVADFSKGTPFCHAPSMMRSEILKEIGGYSEKKRVERMEDFYLWYCFYKAGYKGYNLSEHLYMMRDDRNAVARRKRKNRLFGLFTDIEVYRGLGLPVVYSIKSITKNVAIAVLPSSVYCRFHKRTIQKHSYLELNQNQVKSIISSNSSCGEYEFKASGDYSLSVLVPVYNVANYVRKCAESIFSQSLKNMQIIFIDDCSTDNSIDIIKEVLDEYPSRKKDTIFCSMSQNSGQSSVRRLGYLIAEGEYVISCDSDDWVDSDYYELMYKKALQENADVVVGGFQEHFKRKNKIQSYTVLGTGKDILSQWGKEPIHMSLCNKLIKREILSRQNILPYKLINMWEDNGLMHRVLYYSENVVSVSNCGYHYNRINASSITNSYTRSAINQMIACANLLEDFYDTRPDASRYESTRDILKYLARINLVTDNLTDFELYKLTFPETDRILEEVPRTAFSNRGYLRFLFVKNNLGRLFVLLNKMRTIFTKIG